MKYYHSHVGGFSLVETLVAITILLIIIVGPMTVITTTARSTNFSKSQVTAFFLAQEGAELAQKARDDVLLGAFDEQPGVTWSSFVNGATFSECFKPTGCALQLNSSNVVENKADCEDQSCALYLNNTLTNNRSRYTYDAGAANDITPFTRTIKFTKLPNTDEIRVVSEVSWFDGQIAGNRSVEVETFLFNVYDK